MNSLTYLQSGKLFFVYFHIHSREFAYLKYDSFLVDINWFDTYLSYFLCSVIEGNEYATIRKNHVANFV